MTTQHKGKGKLASACHGSYAKRMQESNHKTHFPMENIDPIFI